MGSATLGINVPSEASRQECFCFLLLHLFWMCESAPVSRGSAGSRCSRSHFYLNIGAVYGVADCAEEGRKKPRLNTDKAGRI